MKKIYVLLLLIVLILSGCNNNTSDSNLNVSLVCDEKWVSGYAPLSIETDNYSEIKKVSFFIDNTLLTEDNTAPYEYQLDTTPYTGGTYKIKANVATVDNTNIIAEKDLYIKHYMPDLYVVSPDWAGAIITRWNGLAGSEYQNIYDATITVNGVELSTENSTDYYYYPIDNVLNIVSGETATFKVTHPDMVNVTESIEVPYTARNLTTPDNLDDWINGSTQELVLNWDQPLDNNLTLYSIYIDFYDSNNKYLSSTGSVIYGSDVPDISYDDTSCNIPSSVIVEGTKYVEILIRAFNERELGHHRTGDTNYGYSISASADSNILTNRP